MENSRIRELRIGLDLSQERFAQLLGVSVQTVRRWEIGLTKPLPIISLKLEELEREVNARGERNRRPGGIPMGGPTKPGAENALGLGVVLKGIGSLLELVSRMAEEGAEETGGTGQVETLGGTLKGVYGLTVRTGLGGRPVIEKFGNIQETEAGAVVTETREPLVDVLDEEDQVVVIAELPGLEEQDIHLNLEGDILEIAASNQERKYLKAVLLPAAVDPKSLETNYRSGVMEIRLTKQQGRVS